MSELVQGGSLINFLYRFDSCQYDSMPWKIPEDIKLSECHMYWNPLAQKGGTIWRKLKENDPDEYYFIPRDKNIVNRHYGYWFSNLENAKKYVEDYYK